MEHWHLLPHLTGIRLQGPDAQAFAHSQFTTAFSQDTPSGWGLTAWCNPKGRVISTLLARVEEQRVELVAPSCLGEVLAKRLPMYSIGRKVEISTGLTVGGRLDCRSQADHQIRVAGHRGLILTPADARLDEAFIATWKALDVCAGIVWLTSTQSEQHIPQALGLQERQGLSFNKGCYPGQEIVARVHYLGRAKQMLKGFRIRGATQDSIEDLIDAEALFDEGGAPVGAVVSAAMGSEGVIGLTVVGIDTSPDQVFRLGSHSGRLCDPGDLS